MSHFAGYVDMLANFAFYGRQSTALREEPPNGTQLAQAYVVLRDTDC
jgi:hypothetical protein